MWFQTLWAEMPSCVNHLSLHRGCWGSERGWLCYTRESSLDGSSLGLSSWALGNALKSQDRMVKTELLWDKWHRIGSSPLFNRNFLFLIMYACTHLCVFMCTWVQMPLEPRVARSLELKLKVIVSSPTRALGIEFRFSERAVCILKSCALSPINLLGFLPNKFSNVSLCKHSFSFIDPGIAIFLFVFRDL